MFDIPLSPFFTLSLYKDIIMFGTNQSADYSLQKCKVGLD